VAPQRIACVLGPHPLSGSNCVGRVPCKPTIKYSHSRKAKGDPQGPSLLAEQPLPPRAIMIGHFSEESPVNTGIS